MMKNHILTLFLSCSLLIASFILKSQPTNQKNEKGTAIVNQNDHFPIVVGKIQRLKNFQSKFVDERNIDIWLPENFDRNTKYNVLYMHDGQMLFDSLVNWNHQEWGIDETLDKLSRENKINACIVVGIWNNSKRHAEYFPKKVQAYLTENEISILLNSEIGFAGNCPLKDGLLSDNYLKFIVSELKPYIDSIFPTYTSRENTFIAGSSMGGLISMYAICEYPDIFGGAACLSTHWPGTFITENNPVPEALRKYMNDHLPAPNKHKIYFDYGSETLDALYKPYQLKADEIMKAKGYTSLNWITLEFPGANHSEKAWKQRFEIPAQFLLEK